MPSPSPAALTPAAVLGLHFENPPQRDAELVGLDDRAHEGGELGRIHPLHHLLEISPALTDAHLAEGERELLRERSVHVLVQLGNRGVEAEPCLHADREEIQCPAARR